MNITLPNVIDPDGDLCNVTSVDFGQASSFIDGNFPTYKLSPTSSDLGVFKISITLIDINPSPKSKSYSFTITVEPAGIAIASNISN